MDNRCPNETINPRSPQHPHRTLLLQIRCITGDPGPNPDEFFDEFCNEDEEESNGPLSAPSSAHISPFPSPLPLTRFLPAAPPPSDQRLHPASPYLSFDFFQLYETRDIKAKHGTYETYNILLEWNLEFLFCENRILKMNIV
ncbi:uncharacterized protein LOC122197681 [Lactuca sativa]|uniref:uncharacterized protein LOC122197681 n=1 Tax=Lactuca sativa TaxID=4236 RepID=UPI001C68BA46|nr:uncharacterized protein LOC122197681 [Lactuca sativa]